LTAWAWTTSRVAATWAGTATSPWPVSPRPSAPNCATTQKPLRRPDPLRGPARTADPARHLDRRLPRLQTHLPRHDL